MVNNIAVIFASYSETEILLALLYVHVNITIYHWVQMTTTDMHERKSYNNIIWYAKYYIDN